MQSDLNRHSLSVETHEEVTMYQSSKVLTIAGQGFNASYTRFRFANSLLEGRNFTQVVTPESATFTLEEGSKWRQYATVWPARLVLLAADAGEGFVPLGATIAKAGRKVATIFEDPRLEPSLQEIGRTLTHEFYLRGTGFTKAFSPVIRFEPLADRRTPINPDAYMVQVVNRTAVKLSLASLGGGWMPREETGNLRVRAINTGGGMYTMDEPVPIAVVVSDDDPHRSGIHLEPDNVTQLYKSSKNKLILEGDGFPMDKEAHLEFGFGGPKEGTFSCSILSKTQLAVTLEGDNKWAHQRGPLFLLKAKFRKTEGDEEEVEYVSPGLKVATILHDPLVFESHWHAYASHTKNINIHGIGFLSTFTSRVKPQLVLSPTLVGDYEIKSGRWTDKIVTISLSTDPGAMWADVRANDQTVEIKVVSIDTGGGQVFMPGGGAVIAEVRKDVANCDDSCVFANDKQCDEVRDGVEAMKRSGARGSRGHVESPAMPGKDSDDVILVNAPICQLGTDCTDCEFELAEGGRCTNTCRSARDGVCDDRRATGLCADGTDCQDCGPWGHSNLTKPVPVAVRVSDDTPHKSGIHLNIDYVTQLYQVFYRPAAFVFVCVSFFLLYSLCRSEHRRRRNAHRGI
ncbi:unnamed protein product [Ectocarpus sp. 4 AP-2014]